MIVQFASFTLDVDVERTRAFYQRSDIPVVGEKCGCVDCRNYACAIPTAPAAVLDFLRSLGIDPQKPTEAYNITGTVEDGTIWYDGWYHLCGSIVESSETIQEVPGSNGAISYCWEYGYQPDPQFPFAVLPIPRADILHKDFPAPVFQLEIDARLPYVLTDGE